MVVQEPVPALAHDELWDDDRDESVRACVEDPPGPRVYRPGDLAVRRWQDFEFKLRPLPPLLADCCCLVLLDLDVQTSQLVSAKRASVPETPIGCVVHTRQQYDRDVMPSLHEVMRILRVFDGLELGERGVMRNVRHDDPVFRGKSGLDPLDLYRVKDVPKAWVANRLRDH